MQPSTSLLKPLFLSPAQLPTCIKIASRFGTFSSLQAREYLGLEWAFSSYVPVGIHEIQFLLPLPRQLYRMER